MRPAPADRMAPSGPQAGCNRAPCERRANATGSGAEQDKPGPTRKTLGPKGGAVKPSTLLIAVLALAGAGSLRAQTAQSTDADRGGEPPLHRDFQPHFLLERRGRLRSHRLDHVPEGPRDHRRLEHPAGQGIAADPGELSRWRVLGDARRQSAKAGQRAVLAGARLRPVPAAGGAQGLGADIPANQAAARIEPVRAAVRIS